MRLCKFENHEAQMHKAGLYFQMHILFRYDYPRMMLSDMKIIKVESHHLIVLIIPLRLAFSFVLVILVLPIVQIKIH